ncbi:secernin 2 [Cyanidiococcus yangmingshanensis]|uniref:Secernin 2 n=1 Tax=Cyanidiococcus yangmingshanensis TaxID=2690220 RepID=A0A7J7IJC5_9RHOD|nr:secernin 2 [Cyanidiococcus yangmingshanensis]
MLERKPFIWYFPGEGTTLNDSCSTVFAVDAVCPSETPLYFEYSGSSDFRAAGNVDSVDKTATVKVPPLTLPGVTNQYQCAFYREAGCSGAVSGVNENGVAVALKFASTRKLRIAPQGQLSGEDLVLTALRYGKTALHAAQLLIQTIEQQGVKSAETGAVFDWTPGLVFADARGAWLLETACGFWALGKVPKVESVFTNNLYIEEPLSHSEDLKSLASLEDCSSPRAAGRISFRQLFAPSEPRESFLQESEPHQTSEKNDSLGKPVDIATIIGRVRQQRPAQACLTDSNPQRNTIRSGAFISILTPDITRRIHLFACEEDTACAMFKPFFLEREGGADLGAAHAAYVSPQGLLHQRRRYALQRRRLDLENSAYTGFAVPERRRTATCVPAIRTL